MKIFVTDGTPQSFFTAVFDAFRENDSVITSDESVQLTLGSEIIYSGYDAEKCGRVKKGIAKYDTSVEDDITLVLRSCSPQKEQVAFKYIKKLMQFKSAIYKRLNEPEVIEFNDLAYKVTGEAHRLKGFLRFMEISGGALYAPYSPDNNITDILMRHFAKRLNSEKFIIHDIKRKIAGIYDGADWIIGYAGEAEIYLSEQELAFESLWKKYYDSVNIKERPHEKQMKGYMPVRYWKFLPEKKNTKI